MDDPGNTGWGAQKYAGSGWVTNQDMQDAANLQRRFGMRPPAPPPVRTPQQRKRRRRRHWILGAFFAFFALAFWTRPLPDRGLSYGIGVVLGMLAAYHLLRALFARVPKG